MNNHSYRLSPAMALCLPLLASAQAGYADPTDPKAPAAPLRYTSAFADYKPWQDIKPGDWRVVNDNVRNPAAKAASHGQSSSAPAVAAPAPGPKASTPAMPGHGGHQMPGSRP